MTMKSTERGYTTFIPIITIFNRASDLQLLVFQLYSFNAKKVSCWSIITEEKGLLCGPTENYRQLSAKFAEKFPFQKIQKAPS